ncbi:MAG: PSD1 and planctomycete cytochrome C domain-containing protein [Opitutales bacterium]|nr:PSD1 and planctomycete cytochrome C domain-containing protein [Opitutales bacterium]
MRLMSKGLWVLPTIYIPLITLFAEANKTIPSVTKKVNVAVIAPDFHREVRPILESTCIQCHGIEKQKGGLRLDTLANAKKGGDSGSALIPGNLEDSLLLDRIFLPADDDEIMPPENGPLSPAQQDILKRWIKAGGHWPQGVQLFPHSERELALRNIANNKKLVELAVHPAQISLSTKEDFNSFVIVAKYDDDITRDVTRESTLSLSNNSVVRMENNLIYPLKDGNSTLTVSFQNRKIELPIMVQDAMVERPVSFNLDVMPVFLKAGCNTGSCHGSARGQDRFMLSLFGYDAKGDHFRITREQGTRRINLAIPEESMLVEKAIAAVPHTGGKLFEKNSDHWNTLVGWLKRGAPEDPKDIAKPTNLELLPRSLLLEGRGARQQMTVVAHYSDGSTRDVTSLSVFQSNNDVSVNVDKGGLITADKRGEAFITARFGVFTKGTQVIVIPEDLKYKKPILPSNNYIDQLVYDKLHKLRIYPSEICSDEVFLRRVYLDVVGAVPNVETISTFIADQSPDKRERAVDELLSRKEFTEMWVMKFAELLQIRTDDNNGVSYKSTLLYFNWIKDRIANNVPMDQIVRDLLTAKGGTFVSPATNYYQIERDNLKITENVAQVFMGMRIQCAQCHDHPFDQWTQDDYYSFASFFSQVGRKQAADPRESVIYNRNTGEINHPVHKKPMPPKFLGGETPEIKKGTDRRQVLADWLASPDNPFFARNLANIVWSHFFGQGIIEPVDDVRISNPPSNPELLDQLASRFTEYKYDFRKLVRDVCTSRIYQLSTRTNPSNEDDLRNFARAQLRRMRAEVLLDVVSQVTKTKNKFQGLPLGARALQIADGRFTNYFLTTFGRATRETVCSCEVVMEPNLSQALHLLNGDVTNSRITQGRIVQAMLKEGKDPETVIENLYLRCYSRKPRADEKANLLASLDGEESLESALNDIFWALLNSKEFIFNH